MAGLRTNYQFSLLPARVYETRLSVQSGLGEALKPMLAVIGTDPVVTVYGSFEEPVGVTLADIDTKMFLIQDNFTQGILNSIPNYLAIIEKSGTVNNITISSVEPTNPVVITP